MIIVDWNFCQRGEMETPDMGKMTLHRVMDGGGGRVPSGMPRALLTMLRRASSLGQTNRAQSSAQRSATRIKRHNTTRCWQSRRGEWGFGGLASDCYATVVRCSLVGGWWRLAESGVANAGLITFATQGESAGSRSSRRTDQEHEQGSGSGKQTEINKDPEQ